MLVTESTICKLIKCLPAGKASGYDEIDTVHIKVGGPMMVTIIT